MHGCLLRLERPGEPRSYLVDLRFYKRGDAKAAVCLLAMSQGVGHYIKEVGEAVQTKLSPESKKLAHQHIYFQLASECEKVRPGNHPIFTFPTDRDGNDFDVVCDSHSSFSPAAFGCTLTVDLSSSAEQPDLREYKVEPEYRTKADAKAAVACLAAEQDVIELLRFQGQPPPVGYKYFWELYHGNTTAVSTKRKEPEDEDSIAAGDKDKRQRVDPIDGQEEGELSSSPCNHCVSSPDILVRIGNMKRNRKGSWKKHSASGSSGLVSLGSSSHTGSLTDSSQYGNRGVRNSMAPYGGSHVSGVGGASASFNLSYGHVPLPTSGYHLPPPPTTTSFQQQNPFISSQFASDVVHSTSPRDPSSSDYFQGRRVIPPPPLVPYGSYPQYPHMHNGPYPTLTVYGHIPNFPLLPLQPAPPSDHASPPNGKRFSQ